VCGPRSCVGRGSTFLAPSRPDLPGAELVAGQPFPLQERRGRRLSAARRASERSDEGVTCGWGAGAEEDGRRGRTGPMGLRRAGQPRALMGAGQALLTWALAPGIPAGAEPGPPPDLEVDPTSVVEGNDVSITVSGTGCTGGDEPARVEIHFVFHSTMPPELTVILRYPRPVTDPGGAWSEVIQVPAFGLVTLEPDRRNSVTAPCFLGTGETEHSFDYEDVRSSWRRRRTRVRRPSHRRPRPPPRHLRPRRWPRLRRRRPPRSQRDPTSPADRRRQPDGGLARRQGRSDPARMLHAVRVCID
jgi:hypothetical protein